MVDIVVVEIISDYCWLAGPHGRDIMVIVEKYIGAILLVLMNSFSVARMSRFLGHTTQKRPQKRPQKRQINGYSPKRPLSRQFSQYRVTYSSCQPKSGNHSAGISGSVRPEWVATFDRNGWQHSTGMGGNIRPEWVATFHWNTHTASPCH